GSSRRPPGRDRRSAALNAITTGFAGRRGGPTTWPPTPSPDHRRARARVMGRPAADLVAPLDEALAAHLLVDADDRLGFRHDLVRESIYADLPASVRKELHAHAARVLGAAGRSALQVAAHVARGAAPGDAEAIGCCTGQPERRSRWRPRSPRTCW